MSRYSLSLPVPLKQEAEQIDALKQQLTDPPASHPRQGWDEAFRAMAEQGADQLLDEDLTGQMPWDEDEWEWRPLPSSPLQGASPQ